MTRFLAALLCLSTFACSSLAADKERPRQVGVGRIDITPSYPIRLCGYASRKTESEGVAQHLFAKALAIGSDKEGPAILITVDNTGVPAHVREEVARRLHERRGIKPERVAVCSSHSHTAPCLAGNLPTMFGAPLPPEQQTHVDRYTRELTDAMEKVALAALKDRRPANLNWGQTKAGFAANRRTRGGPVDHDLPMLVATDQKGKLRAVLANYACHCTTLGGETNQICGDWAGYAQEYLERDHPGATVLVTIGCGADANPVPRTGLDFAKQHGQEIAAAVNELLGAPSPSPGLKSTLSPSDGEKDRVRGRRKLTPVRGQLDCRTKQIELPLDTLPTRAELERQTTNANVYAAYHARWNLARLDRDGALPAKIPYLIQTWAFDDSLGMVFLPGEVVVDYSLRLKKEFDAGRLWVNAYANDVPCYIPSERILKESGYEGGGAMIYYGWPTRIAPGVEDLIVNAVRDLLPKTFLFDEKKAEFPPPKSPQESLASIEAKSGFEVQLVASEPLVVDPVAIDWGADGKLWVVEMRDYPTGMDGNWKPGGRVKILEDTGGNGKYDKAQVVADNIPFPTGVTAWRQGALVCTAPDILYVARTDEDPNRALTPALSHRMGEGGRRPGEGNSFIVRKILSGFATENYQARVNSLSLGLDNWIYGANGLLGGVIRGDAGGKNVDLRGRDFRMNPDNGAFEPASGLTQQGRARDDWGNWFGCDNSTLTWHYPIADHYARRNPHIAAPSPRVSIGGGADPGKVFPISRTLERFNNPQSANRITSVCGLGVYRDNLLGEEYNEDIFVCEPVHNLVRHVVSKPTGVTFSGERAPDEQRSEFLASRDNWFRPAQARTGPDGALYVADMYRFVIEHPRWIPAERLATLDVRAGDDKGRIYRIVPKHKKLRPIQNLRKLPTAKLVDALDTPNGTTRDLIHLELMQRGDTSAIRPLEELASKSKLAVVRLQAMCVLDGLDAVTPSLLRRALVDAHPATRANAVRLSEEFLRSPSPLPSPPGRGRSHSPGVGDLAGAQDSRATGEHSPSPGGEGRGEGERSSHSSLRAALLNLADDPELIVRYQLALSLGEWDDARAGEALGKLATRDMGDAWMRAAILSSATRQPVEILKSVLAADAEAPGRSEMISQLIATAAGEGKPESLGRIIAILAPREEKKPELWQLAALSSLLDAFDRKGLTLASLTLSGAGIFPADDKKGTAGGRPAATIAGGTPAPLLLAPLFAWAIELAAALDTKDSIREPAIRLLGRSPEQQEEDLQMLFALLDPSRSARTHSAALDTLKRIRRPEVASLLLQDWNLRSPSLRQSCIEVLLSRNEWMKQLLAAVESGVIGVSEISPADRQRLLRHTDKGIQGLATTIFKPGHGSRAQVLAKYQSATTLPGDTAKGADLFAKNCSSCHVLRGQGHAVGPTLWQLADKTPADFLLAILDPNAAVEPRFVAYNIETKDGRSLSGIVSAETATTLTVVQGGGAQDKILRSDIAEIRASGLSLMPEGLEQSVTPQDLANLIAYLKSSPRTFGSATSEQAAAAKKKFLDGGMNGFAKIISAFDQLSYPSWMGELPMPYCRQTDGKSKLAWQTALVPADLKPETIHQFRLPAAMGFVSQPSGKFELRLNGRRALDFNVALNDQTWQSADGKVQMSYTVLENNNEDSDGVLLINVSGSLLEPGQPGTFEVVGSAANSQRWFGVYLVPTPSEHATR